VDVATLRNRRATSAKLKPLDVLCAIASLLSEGHLTGAQPDWQPLQATLLAHGHAPHSRAAHQRGATMNTALTRTGERQQRQLTSYGAAVTGGCWNGQDSAGALSLAGSAWAFAASVVIAVLIAWVSLVGLVLGREGLYGSDGNLADGDHHV
jgi:hypothetical protein